MALEVRLTALRTVFSIRMLQANCIFGGSNEGGARRAAVGQVLPLGGVLHVFFSWRPSLTSSWTPGLVLSSDDPEIPLPFAAFRMNRDSSMIPAKMSLEVLGDLCLPFGQGETWNAEEV